MILGINHSTGYPLHALTGAIFCRLLPFKTPAWRTNIMSAAFASLVLGLLCLGNKGKRGITEKILAASILAGATGFIHRALITEVYSQGLFFAGLYILAETMLKGKARASAAGLALGLAMGAHLSYVMLIPGFAIFRYHDVKRGDLPGIFLSTAALVLGLSIYLYNPVRAVANPLISFRDPRNIYNLWAQMSLQGMHRIIGKHSLNDIMYHIKMIDKNIGVPGIILSVIGIGSWLLKDRKTTVAILVSAVGLMALIWTVGNSQSDSKELESFQLPLIFGFSVLAARGIMFLLEKLSNRKAAAGAGIAFIVLMIFRAYTGMENQSLKNYWMPYDHARNTLMCVDESTPLAVWGDDDSFLFWYLQIVMGIRPDVPVIQFRLTSWPWYNRNLRRHRAIPPWVKRDWLYKGDDFEETRLAHALEKNPEESVYVNDYAIIRMLGPNIDRSIKPVGLCFLLAGRQPAVKNTFPGLTNPLRGFILRTGEMSQHIPGKKIMDPVRAMHDGIMKKYKNAARNMAVYYKSLVKSASGNT